MSKCISSGEIKANPQVDSSDSQEKSSTPQVKELTVQELISEERHEFMNYLKEFYELQVTEYEKIEREVLPRNHSDNKKLYKNAQVWRKDVLMKSKNAVKFQASHMATKTLDLEVEIDRQKQEQEEREAKKNKKLIKKMKNKYLIIF
ncbi:hypothetical protein F8M41_000048 [Gigaspora margarita]|uniref:Uncharacterized protein n=1 Tax=Gigaspora margarita TaxID=4874 RepID=A0A8H4EWC8_GIGMA|nr:hypothetical protein F8M41_000048 [Gigaspora margarita]